MKSPSFPREINGSECRPCGRVDMPLFYVDVCIAWFHLIISKCYIIQSAAIFYCKWELENVNTTRETRNALFREVQRRGGGTNAPLLMQVLALLSLMCLNSQEWSSSWEKSPSFVHLFFIIAFAWNLTHCCAKVASRWATTHDFFPKCNEQKWYTWVWEAMKFVPVVRPLAYSESTAWMATYMAGTLKVSNMIWVIRSRLALGLRGASVSNTGCSSGATRSSL